LLPLCGVLSFMCCFLVERFGPFFYRRNNVFFPWLTATNSFDSLFKCRVPTFPSSSLGTTNNLFTLTFPEMRSSSRTTMSMASRRVWALGCGATRRNSWKSRRPPPALNHIASTQWRWLHTINWPFTLQNNTMRHAPPRRVGAPHAGIVLFRCEQETCSTLASPAPVR
jgi:hypothetical protein